MPRKAFSKYRMVPCPCPADHTSQRFISKRRQNRKDDDRQSSGRGHCMRVAEGHEDTTVICTTCSDRWGHSQASSAMCKSRAQNNSLTRALDAYPAYKAACSGEDRNPLEWRLYYRKWLSQDQAGAPNVPDDARSIRKPRRVAKLDTTREEKRTLIHSDNAIRGWRSRREYREASEERPSIDAGDTISETYPTRHLPGSEIDFNRPQEGIVTSYDHSLSTPSEASATSPLTTDFAVESKLYATLLVEGYGSPDTPNYGFGNQDALMTSIPSSCGYSTNPVYTEPDWDIP
ncbi:uncharacterized protein L199_001676 [Kwoniella botswanensis]|uniref:uncharacterized protein n=1 Tax=Kwoniella botswanensis TaxID=1268659 RepID=UPI00315DDDF0